MEFTLDSVIDAINTARTPLGLNQDQTPIQNAQIFLEQWTHSNNGLVLAMQILLDNDLQYFHKVYAASLIKIQVPLVWGKIPSETRIDLRTHFYNFFDSCDFPNNDLLFNMIIDILVSIALFEFPQDWPDLNLVVLSDLSPLEDGLKKCHYYHFIAQLLSTVDVFSYITPNRVQYLRNLFLDNSQILFQHINTCFSNEELFSDGLKIFNGFLRWASFEQVMPTIETFHQICFQFVYNPNTKKEALDCLTTLFASRNDSSSFVTLTPLIITSLGSPQSVFPNGKHATSDPDVLNFLMRVLAHFLTILLSIYDPSNKTQRTEAIRASMDQAKVSPDDFRTSLYNIVNVIISIQSNSLLTEEYWTFWITVFHNMFTEKKMISNPFKPTIEFMNVLFPNIRQAIYECVPLDNIYDTDSSQQNETRNLGDSSQYSVFCTNRSRNAWSLIAQIDPEGTLNFLKEQAPSEALCYAIGNLEFCSQSQFDINLLSTELNELYALAQSGESDPDLYVALLFCFSHTLSFDSANQTFMSFVDFATRMVNENPPVSTAATNALYYASRRNLVGFMNEQYISLICELSETYLRKLNQEDAVRMYKIASSLVCKMSTKEQMMAMYEKISIPLLQAMDAYFELEKIFECIKEACYAANESCSIFLSFLWPKLLEMTNQIIHTNAPAPILEAVLDTDSAGISSEMYDEEKTNLILSWMVDRTQTNLQIGHPIEDSFYNFIAVIRSQHIQLNTRLPDIINMFIDPVLPKGLASYSAVMSMLSEFTFQIYDFPWFVSAAIESIQSYNKEDNTNGLRCVSLLISRLNSPEKFVDAIKNNIIPPIVTAVFASLTDTMHKDTIQRLIQFIKMLMIQSSKYNLINDELFNEMFLTAIRVNVQEPVAGLFLNFIATLKINIEQPFQFSKIISDFLILIRKISPNDTDAFKVMKTKPELASNRGRIIKIKDGQTQEIVLNDQKHFRIFRKPNGF